MTAEQRSLLGLALLGLAAVSYGRTDDVAVTLSALQPWVYLGKFGFAVGNSTVSAQPAAPIARAAISRIPFVVAGERSCSATPARDGGRWGGALLEGGCDSAIWAATRASPREVGDALETLLQLIHTSSAATSPPSSCRRAVLCGASVVLPPGCRGPVLEDGALSRVCVLAALVRVCLSRSTGPSPVCIV